MSQWNSLLVIVVVITFASCLSASAENPPLENLNDLIATSLANSPELKSSHARWQMFVNRSRQAGALEDPMIMFKLQNMVAREPFVFNKDPQSAKVFGITQQVPFWGKRAIRQEVASIEAQSYKWTLEERKLELVRMVKESYYQLYSVDKSLEIVEKNLRILDDFKIITESKYSVGQGVQQDIFKASLEKSRILDQQISLRQQRKSLEANMNYLLSRPDGTSIGRIADFQLPAISLSARELKTTAFERQPRIKSLLSMISKGEASHRLAQKESYPDFNLALEYMFREESGADPGYNMFSLGVTFNLPLQRERRHAMVAEASSETDMSREELNGLRNSISYSVNDLLAQMESRRKLVELYREGIIPQAEQSLESAIISYRVNKVDFLTLLDGRANLYTYERELYESLAEYMIKLAQLEAVVGVELLDLQKK